MIKCCQNCHYFRKGADVCESGEIITNTDLWMAVQLLLENGEIAGLCEDLGIAEYRVDDAIAEFFQDRLQDASPYVNIKDPQNFCCNAWR